MDDRAPDSELARVRLERDLYRRLLELGVHRDREPFLEQALGLVVEVVGARQGYIELHDASDEAEEGWWIAHGFSASEVDDVRGRISHGIIAEALATGRTVDTASALRDPRFLGRRSVQTEKIEAVLCVPIGRDPTRGALYLQGRHESGAFSPGDRDRAELFARHLAPLVDGLSEHQQIRVAADATAPLRERLRAECLVGRSAALAALLREVAVVAPLDLNVLLTGESGTGKSQVARVIHESGPRAGRPMVELNCAALPETLVESELFGALAGSHSTATRAMPGKVAAAEGGTLLLDEIGDLSFPAQAKLLQLLQTREYYPLGASEPRTANIRLIAATNVDLEAAVRNGTFREDLFYRLNVLPIRVPALRERPTDVPELARFFCERACVQHRLPRLDLSPAALRALEAAEWPGNVRQLDNAIEAGAARAAGLGASRIEQQHLFPDRLADAPPGGEPATLQEATRRFQSTLLRRTLDDTGWNVTETARRLDIARSHVYRLISAFGLERGA